MDSLSGRPKPEVVKNIKTYLEHELQVKTQKSNDFSFLSVFYPSVPRQPNFTDCGLYLLQFVECFLKVSRVLSKVIDTFDEEIFIFRNFCMLHVR